MAGIFQASSAASPDAIGIRVAPNPKHYSALSWYQSQGFGGSPQMLIVDGYEAIRDGRTVYINVANVVETAPINNELSIGDLFYTNIFVISYNQDAEKATEDIFGQILSYWKFNNNILKVGTCLDEPAKSCVYGASCAQDDFCGSSHDVSVRDTRRLADLTVMNELLDRYKSSHDGFCPSVSSGSYLPGKSVSTWPSWQESLGKALGASLPFDPINRMGTCPGYNSMTCWNEQSKKFAGTSTPSSIILPGGSHAYTYYATPDNRTCYFFAATESRLSCIANGTCTVGANISVSLDFSTPGANRAPFITCGNMVSFPHTPFSKFISANDLDPGDNNGLTWTIDTSGTAWTNWSAAPILQKTVVKNQRQVFAGQSGDKGNYLFNVTVTDARGSSTSKTCNIGLGITVPEIMPIANQSVYSGEEMNAFTVFASEPEKDYPLTFTFTGDNLTTGATVNNIFTCGSVSPVFGEPNGRYNCYLNKQAVNQPGGEYQVTVKATDPSGDTSSITYMLDVINHAPALTVNNPTWEASTTILVNQTLWEAVDLLSNLPIAFSNVPALPNGITPSTAIVNRPNTTVSYAYGSTVTNTSVGVRALQYNVSGALANTNIFSAPITVINLTAAVTDTFSSSSNKTYAVRVNNSAPVVGPLGCAATARHSIPYSCTFPVNDANGNTIANHASAGLPAGLLSTLSGNSITINGAPTLASVGLHNITVKATDEFSFTGANAAYALNVVTYCGDNIMQNPNGEGGPESCDINAGVAPNPAGSLPTKQYACTAACAQTGGWCGDTVVQAPYGEFCDGTAGVAPNPAGSLPTKQYACTAACAQTGGWCGDGIVQVGGGENCDDGNNTNSDGCSSACSTELHYTCVGSPSVCTPDTQTVACIGAAANSDWNVSPTVLQTWTGTMWWPPNNAAYSVAPGICKYVCQACFHWNGASCVADFCGDGSCNCTETYASCAVDACAPACPDPTTTLVFDAGHGGWFCAKSAYTWAKQLDHTADIHFHNDGTITYTNESAHGVLSANAGYTYPFTFTASSMFPAVAGTFYDLNVGGSTCSMNGAATVGPTEIIVPILEPSGGEHVCSAEIQQNVPAQ
jgi:cysteine-rich repeat protein